MACGVHLRRSPCCLNLADPVVEISGIRSLEVNHLVGCEELALLARRSVQVAFDELLLAWDDVHPLRRHRPELDWTVRHLVDDGMQVGVSRELGIQDAKNRRVVSVLIRVHLRQKIEDRMVVGDDLVIVSVFRCLAKRVHRRRVRRVTGEIRLRATRHARRLPELVAVRLASNIEPQRSRCDGDRVQVCRSVDPRSIRIRSGERAELLPLRILTGCEDRHG